MDLNFVLEVITVLAFVSFVGIAIWAYSSASRSRFDAAARAPLDEPRSLTESER
jgi:cbb3-type cytochrome oxidase subunit 3